MTTVSPERALEDVVRRQLANITSRPHTANECTDAILAAAARYAASILPSLPAKQPPPPPVQAADGATPGQRAHRIWLQTRWPDLTPQAITRDWELISLTARAAWEAVAAGTEG